MKEQIIADGEAKGALYKLPSFKAQCLYNDLGAQLIISYGNLSSSILQ